MNKPTKFSSNAQAQRKRLLDALQNAKGKGITSYQASRELDIYHPPARIKELRQQGYHIVTLWETIETEKGTKHRVGRYVLMSSKGVAA